MPRLSRCNSGAPQAPHPWAAMLGRSAALDTPGRLGGANLRAALGWALVAAASLPLALTTAPLSPVAAESQGSLQHLAYLALEALSPAQGMVTSTPTSLGWFNPGADVDASASTDGEDLAAPLADVTEFRSKDAALAADYHFGPFQALNAALGAAAAGHLRVLANDMAEDHL